MSEEIKRNDLSEEEALHVESQANLPQEEQNSEDTAEKSDTSSDQEPTLEEQYAQLQDAHLRLMAEYDNYRKRTLKEKSELIRNGGEKVLRDLLPVVDDLDIALANIASAEDIEAVREGIGLIYNKFIEYLSRQGVKSIETSECAFDEELHEAIATFPAPNEELKGKIIDCVKKGYTLHDKVLRHASVVVGQ